jgi:hypothetical protein
MQTVALPQITREQAEAEPTADRLQFDRKITISAQVQYRGRSLTVVSEGYTADQLCDLLDKRFGTPEDAPIFRPQASTNGHAPATDDAPLCPLHRGRAMKRMKFASKQGHMWMCTHRNDAGDYCPERA